MGYNLIRYGVKDESIAENRMLVAQVFEALDDTKPQSVRPQGVREPYASCSDPPGPR